MKLKFYFGSSACIWQERHQTRGQLTYRNIHFYVKIIVCKIIGSRVINDLVVQNTAWLNCYANLWNLKKQQGLCCLKSAGGHCFLISLFYDLSL